MTPSSPPDGGTTHRPVPASFRDPAGRIIVHDGDLVRVVFDEGRDDYLQLMKSGLYDRLVKAGLLVPHEEIAATGWQPERTWRLLRPTRIPFISYASEWSFSQLRDAALTTLRVQQEALKHGMVLKDAPTANIQFLDGRAVLVDTLSLITRPQTAWIAYYQFCKHFLGPLLLASSRDPRLLKLLGVEPDGVPLDLASRLLPLRTWLKPSALMHIHLHARIERRGQAHAGGGASTGAARIDVLVDSLLRAVEGLRWNPPQTEWTRYENERPTHSPAAWSARMAFVEQVLLRRRPHMVWDFGAATGHLSRLATEKGAFTVAFDADLSCVETMYRQARASTNERLLPLVMDLLQPSSPGGWGEEERGGLAARGPADLVLALGLIHHLGVKGAVPLDRQLEYFAKVGRSAVIEFVPAEDPIVQQWSGRFNVDALREPDFQSAASRHFRHVDRQALPESVRVLYFLTNA